MTRVTLDLDARWGRGRASDISIPLLTSPAAHCRFAVLQWTLAQLRRRLFAEGKEDKPLWARVSDLVILTLLTLAEVCSGEETGFSIAVFFKLRPSCMNRHFARI